jgi:hypothetical protein
MLATGETTTADLFKDAMVELNLPQAGAGVGGAGAHAARGER